MDNGKPISLRTWRSWSGREISENPRALRLSEVSSVRTDISTAVRHGKGSLAPFVRHLGSRMADNGRVGMGC